MGMLVEGKWKDVWYDTESNDGRFKRQDAQFRNFVKADGSTPYQPEAGRYHLYVSLACPWAHRTLIFRKLKKLEGLLSLSIVDTFMGENGWEFSENEGCIPDTVNGSEYLYQVYTKADPTFTGRVTVPVLWDKKRNEIVNNESSEIIRMLNTEFAAFTDAHFDFYPAHLRKEIDEINDEVYHHVNNGVYKSGFATKQEAYEEAFDALFGTLEKLEARLSKQPYLCGDVITEADWRLFTTLVRFDPVYHSHFKCNHRRIEDYPQLSDYLRALFQVPGVAETCNFDHIKKHYYQSHESVNPTRIVPKGPLIDLSGPHIRPNFEQSLYIP